MKRSSFGEIRIQPGDDLYATWIEEFNPDDLAAVSITARSVEEDPNFGWTCSLMDNDGNEAECHDFQSEEALRTFLTEQGVEIE